MIINFHSIRRMRRWTAVPPVCVWLQNIMVITIHWKLEFYYLSIYSLRPTLLLFTGNEAKIYFFL